VSLASVERAVTAHVPWDDAGTDFYEYGHPT
jgi:hypothetical protein